MNGDDALLDSLRTAVTASPNDVPLRLHLAELLIRHGHTEEAISHLGALLARDPGNARATGLMRQALDPANTETTTEIPHAAALPAFDWVAAEAQIADLFPPRPAHDSGRHRERGGEDATETTGPLKAVPADDRPAGPNLDVTAPRLRLSDIDGMAQVKKRLDAAFLAPLRDPRARVRQGAGSRGRLLLYGPPGCGKLFLAGALAGEIGARFLPLALDDVLEQGQGGAERALRSAFEQARRHAPCVLFLDELDGLGRQRAQSGAGGRAVANQLLTELDALADRADGVFVLAATSRPWDVDATLRRPGRFDRAVLVLPPDEPARKAILDYHLRDRPVSGVKLGTLARRTEGFSGEDLAHVCENAAERALLDAAETGQARPIGMPHLLDAAAELRPSTGPWFASARNVALYGNDDGSYDDLLAYLRKKKLL